MHLDLITAAELAAPVLRDAAAAGMSNCDLFKSALSEHRHALCEEGWLVLFLTLQALTATPTAAPPVRIAPVPAVSPAVHAPLQAARQ